MQFLFGRDLHGGIADGGPEEVWSLREIAADDKALTFARELVEGVIVHQDEIDALIRKYAANFDFSRIGAVERNVMRVAVYELKRCPDTPPAVAINEAIEAAKKFGDKDSGKFVNGVLDSIRKELAAAGEA